MLIDCERCAVRGLACSDCVVTVLLGSESAAGHPDLDESERAALDVLAAAELVPELRLVPVAVPARSRQRQPRRRQPRRRAG